MNSRSDLAAVRNQSSGLRALAILALAAACTHPVVTPPNGSTQTGGQTTVSGSVGPSGGTVALSNGTGVTIPAGALSSTTTITVTQLTTYPAPAGATLVGSPLLLTPEGQQFSQPVTVTLTIDSQELPAGSGPTDVVVVTTPQSQTNFSTLGGSLVNSTTIQAQTTHFSVFEPVVPGATGDAGPDAGVDAGPDAGVDAGSDGGVDGGADAGDAGHPVGPTVALTSPSAGQLVTTGTPSIGVSVVSGTAASVSVTLTNLATSAQTTLSATGSGTTWSATPTSALASDHYSVTATGTDSSGNVGPTSSAVDFTIDATLPSAPAITSPTSAQIVTTSTPTFLVTAPSALASVVLTITDSAGDTITPSATNNEDGTWSYTPTSGLPNGTTTVSAVATDVLGGSSTSSTTVTFVIDTTEPAAPTITSPTAAQIVTTATPTFLVTATGSPASVTVTVTDHAGNTSNLRAQNTGGTSWSATATTALPNGAATVYAVSTDSLGGTSPQSSTITFTVDSTVPAAPVITSPTSGQLVTTQTPTFTLTTTGSVQSVSVTVTVNGTPTVLAATSGSSGNWSAMPATNLANGTASVTATATDSFGGISASATVVSFTIDGTQPAAPTITAPQNNAILTTGTPTFTATSGSSAAKLAFTVLDGTGNKTVFDADNNGGGNWSATPSTAIADGDYSVTAVATDSLGYASNRSTSISFVIDTNEPVAPTVTSPTSNAFVSTTTPTFTVTATGSNVTGVNVTVTDSSNTPVVLQAVNTAGTTWTATPVTAFLTGSASVYAVAVDSLGGSSPPSTTVDFTIDTQGLVAPLVTSPTASAVVTTTTPTITVTAGSAAASVTVTIVNSANNSVVLAATETAQGSGTWTATPSALPLGATSVSAVATDNQGDTTAPGPSVDFTIDTDVPSAPTVTSPTSGQVVTTQTPTFVVSAPSSLAGVTVAVVVNGGTPITIIGVNNNNNTWSATAASALATGPASVTAVSIDALQDPSPASASVSFVIDPNAPVVAITSPTAAQVVTTQTPTVTVTVESGAPNAVSVTLTDSSNTPVTLTATNNNNGTWSATPVNNLQEGNVKATATATDLAGNSGGVSASVTFKIDTTVAPVSITSPTSGQVVTTAEPTFSALVNTASVVSVSITVTVGANTPVTLGATNTGNGTWTATPTSSLGAGAAAVYTTATDALTDTFTSNTVDFTIDTNAPPAPTWFSPTASQILPTQTPTLTVTAGGSTASVTITVTDSQSNQQTLTATSNNNGTWSATPATNLANGDATAYAVAYDSSNGASPQSATIDFVVDGNEPSTPSITSPTGGGVVNTTTPSIVVSSGGSTNSVSVTVTDAQSNQQTLSAENTGENNWTAIPTTALAQGGASATAVATDQYGGSSPTSQTATFVVDTNPPPQPTITSPTTNQLLTGNKPTIAITAGGSATSVTVTITASNNAQTVLIATNTGGSSWTATPLSPLPDGDTSVSAVATDNLGGTSPTSSAVPFVIDTHIPSAPTVTLPTQGQVVTSSKPTFNATAGQNTNSLVFTVVDSHSNTTNLTATLSSGTWSATPTTALPSGSTSVSAVATDALGGSSSASTSVSFTIDTNLPPTPTITAPVGSQVVSTAKPAFTATAGGSTRSLTFTVTDSANNTQNLSATNTSGSTWSATATTALAAGGASVYAVGSDGLTSSQASSTVNFTVDLNEPTVVISSPTANALLTMSTPVVTATVTNGTPQSVTIIVTDSSDTPHQLSATNNNNGTWSATAPALPDGVTSAAASASDSLGGSGGESASVSFTIDTHIPEAPTITAPTSGLYVTTAKPAFTATSAATTASLSFAVIDSNGHMHNLSATNTTGTTWSATPSGSLPTGDTSVTATATDSLGGTSPASSSVAFVIDTNPPPQPVITAPTSNQIVTTTTPTFTVSTATSGTDSTSTLSVTVIDSGSNKYVLAATNEGGSNWSVTATTALALGTATVTAVGQDGLGDTSAVSAGVSFVVDPNLPFVSISAPTTNQIVTSTRPTLTATVTSGTPTSVTISVTDSGNATYNLAASNNGNGTWSATPTTALATGTAAVVASAEDILDESGGASSSVSFIVDPNYATLSITSPTSGELITTLTPTFTATVTAGSPSSVTIVVTDAGNNTYDLTATNNGGGSWTATATTNLVQGAASVYATATDSLNETATSGTISFTVNLCQGDGGPSYPAGKTCWSCTATANSELINQCAQGGAVCYPFSNSSRIPSNDFYPDGGLVPY